MDVGIQKSHNARVHRPVLEVPHAAILYEVISARNYHIIVVTFVSTAGNLVLTKKTESLQRSSTVVWSFYSVMS